MSYYDVDDILAESSTVPCVFNVDAVDLGYFDDSSDEQDVAFSGEF